MNPSRVRLHLALLGAILLAAPGAAQEWRFDVTPGQKLTVDLKTGGSVEIHSASSAVVTVEATIHGRDAKDVSVTAEAVAGGVRIGSEFTRKLRNSSAGVDLEITVPSRFDLDLETMGGSIEIEKLEGTVEGETMGGSIHLSGIHGHVELSTMGGEIEVTDSVAEGKVSTMGGNVTFDGVEGGLKGTTMGGNVRINGASQGRGVGLGSTKRSGSDGEVVEITSMGGRIDVGDAPAGARVSTMGGGIRVDSAKRFVVASTMGGSIDVREVDGKVDLSTMGGDVTARVVGEGGDVEIESMSGDIELTLPAGFGASFDIDLDYTRNSRRTYQIRSDFPLEKSETKEWRYSKGSPRKTIHGTGSSGSGTHQVRIHTINGDVVIKKGG